MYPWTNNGKYKNFMLVAFLVVLSNLEYLNSNQKLRLVNFLPRLVWNHVYRIVSFKILLSSLKAESQNWVFLCIQYFWPLDFWIFNWSITNTFTTIILIYVLIIKSLPTLPGWLSDKDNKGFSIQVSNTTIFKALVNCW